MKKINGTEHVEYDRELITGYALVSAALVDAACERWLRQHGLSHESHGRRALSAEEREQQSRERQQLGFTKPRVVRIRRSQLSRSQKAA